MMKKFLACAMALCMGIGLCACGGGGESGNSSERTLKVTIRGNDTSEALLNQKLQKAFVEKKAKEGVTVKFETPSTFNAGTYMQSIDTLAGANNLGDIVYTYDTDSGLEIKSKMFEPLDDYIANDPDFDLADYDTSIINSARTYNNQIAFMPRSFDQMTIMINKGLFKELDLESEIPTTDKYGADWENWTWDEMIRICEELRAAMNEKYGNQSSQYYPLVAKFFYNAVYGPVIESFGGNCVDIENMDSGFNTTHPKHAATVKALEWMQSLVEQKLTTYGNGNFSGGNNAMVTAVRTSVPVYLKAGIDLAFAPLPKFTKNQTGLDNTTTYVGFGSGGYAMNAESRNKELAWEFIKFTASEEGQMLIAENGACVPILNSMLTQNASWMKVDALRVGDSYIDQSAFVTGGLTRMPATFARGVAVQDESTIYTDTNNFISNDFIDENFNAENLSKKIYDKIKKYIKSE